MCPKYENSELFYFEYNTKWMLFTVLRQNWNSMRVAGFAIAELSKNGDPLVRHRLQISKI